jgi:hypothetical protein
MPTQIVKQDSARAMQVLTLRLKPTNMFLERQARGYVSSVNEKEM